MLETIKSEMKNKELHFAGDNLTIKNTNNLFKKNGWSIGA